MSDFWDKWAKPWTREQCDRRYVQGNPAVSIRALVHDSGVPKSSLEVWSKQDDWKTRRRQYQDKLRTQTEEKTIEKTSDRLSDELSDIAVEHFKAYKLYRQLSEIQASYLMRQCEQQDDPDLVERTLKALNPIAINAWSLVLDRSIKGERIALNLDKQGEDPNKIIEAEFDVTKLTIEELQTWKQLMEKAKKEAES